MGWGQRADIVCPECRTRDATKGLFGQIRCRNPRCGRHDASLGPQRSTSGMPVAIMGLRGDFDPGANRVTVTYRNFRGEDREFTGDRTTLRMTKHHCSFRVAPTGKRIALAKRFITNLAAVEQALQGDIERSLAEGRSAEPNALERQILSYHLTHHTTSPRYEEVRRKYPHWSGK